ncbi:trypsin-like peptidase domain-containing protein [Streptomyces sp. NBC_01092]|uniref:trypsin-like peptidase domain-containing protein n=1 Tax=Streptomyces sp. NBC_01092 TaxID=2903748 RepID=UPI0038643CC7|nr:trypsin-like peptidase domain-containing protein [Streptomyces sp. NBC_01092]
MNEGKPAKAKWWNRPRPQGASGHAEGATPTPGETMPVTPDAGPSGSAGDVVSADGDFELARPAAGASGDAASAEGDFELRPAASGVADMASDEGDFELARPAGAPAPLPSADAVIAPSADALMADSADQAAAPAAPVAEHPKPLHDPDPYSTPPYGEPGPWAPAPPVQHPATTPAHGTAVPMPPAPRPAAPAQGAQAGPVTSVAAPAPTAGVSAPVPAPTPGMPTQETRPAAPAAAIPAPSATIPTQPSPALAPPPPATLDQPAPADTPPPTDPWQNYDPWARAALPVSPLQQNGAGVASKQQRRKRAKRVLFVGALVLALVSGGVGGVVGAYLERNGGMGDVELPQAGAESVGRAPDSVAGIAERALPSVVTLHVSGSEEQGTGTGFVLDDRGHILTNNHVVEPAGDDGRISVTFHSGDTAKATVVGRDSGYDLAVVKVTDVSGLKPLPLGNSDNVQVGDPVVAIGAPFDLEGTVTSGIISAKERPITAGGESDASDVSYVDALQTDAPINPGNSGGPLLDAQARVVGINSAIRSADTGSDLDAGQAGSIGLGFAIPVNQAKRVAEELINTGHATHPVIGVTLDMDYAGDGARVGTKGSDGGAAVTDGGPGDKAGIKPGDVITEVDGQRVHSGEELIVKTRAHRPGDRLELTLERGGKEITISLTLGSSGGG